jgi:hypothetical protein
VFDSPGGKLQFYSCVPADLIFALIACGETPEASWRPTQDPRAAMNSAPDA